MGTQTIAQRVIIKNILVLTDFSPASDSALRYSIDWARRLGATVHIVHFIRTLQFTMTGDAYGMLIERVWRDGREGLAEIDASKMLAGVPHETYLEGNEILDGVAAFVPDHHIDLVVLASSGRRGLEKVLLGSTAEALFRSVPSPVLILGPSCQRQRTEPRVILYATDFGPAAGKAAQHALSLAQESQARLHLLTVMPPGDSDFGSRVADLELGEARLRALVPAGAEAWCQAEAEVRFGHAAEEIVKAAAEIGADLIVLGAKRAPKLALYTGWATAYQVLGEAPCPVLTVRE